MEATIIKTLALENGHTLEILDRSKKIGEDAWQVTLTARMAVPVQAGLFAETVNAPSLEEIHRKIGTTATFTHDEERNFIMDADKEAVFSQLMDTVLGTLMPYVSKPSFPQKFILKCCREK